MIRPRLLLADDHASFLEAETTLLRPHFDIVGTAKTGHELVAEAIRLSPDVIVADITMPELTGIEAASKLRESGCSSALVFLTVHAEQAFIRACLSKGALGYVLKNHMKDHLVVAIESALAGQIYVSPSHFK